MKLPSPPLLVITDRSQARVPLEEIALAAFLGGCRWMSVREKDLPAGDRLELARRIAALAAGYDAVVGVHDDAAAALALDCALHLPAGAGVEGGCILIGRSAHAEDDLGEEGVAGLDYVTLSPVFTSASKPEYGPALGLEGLAAAVQRAAVPVIALGGIDGPDAVRACREAGAAGVAVMGGLMRADDPIRWVRSLVDAFDQVS